MTARHGFTYPAILEVAERINWRVEDLIGGDKRLDFAQPFSRNRSPGSSR
jgi:hypothetical protein